MSMALEHLDGLFDAISSVMHEAELTETEYDIQHIYEFHNYTNKIMEGE